MGSEAVSLVENSRSTVQSVMSVARQTGRFRPCDPSGRLVASALSPPFPPLDTCAPGALRCSASAKGGSPNSSIATRRDAAAVVLYLPKIADFRLTRL